MKKLILTFGLIIAGIFFATAQSKTENKAANLVNQLNQICGLTQDQAAKLQPVAENYLKTRKANKIQYATDPAGRKSANKIAAENYKAQLKTILTPEQIAKIKEYHTQQKTNRKGGQQESNGQPEEGGGQQ
jgi:hypothetical protein